MREADPARRGLIAAHLVELGTGQRERFPVLADALDEACPGEPLRSMARKLSYVLRSFKGRVDGGWRIAEAATRAHGGLVRWVAEPIDPPVTPADDAVLLPIRDGAPGRGDGTSYAPSDKAEVTL